MKKIITATILLLSLLTYSQATDMKMTDVTGKTYSVKGTEEGLDIQGLKGKVVFLEFFGHRCPPCLASIPNLIKLQNRYKNKLAIIAIEVQGYTDNELRSFVKNKNINYITISEEKAGGVIDYIAQRAEWRGSIPFLVAMDTKGSVQFVQAGMLPESSLEQLIKELSK